MKKVDLIINKAKYLAEESILLYNDTSPLRLSILGIPKIGAFIDSVLSSKGQQISYNRLIGFINELEKEIKQIDERVINLEFLASEEFYDLLIEIFEASLKTRHEEKRQLYARILANRCITTDVKINPEFFIDTINDLKIEELLVAIKLYEIKTTELGNTLKAEFQGNNIKSYVRDRNLLALTDLNIEEDDYNFILLRLERYGLIKEQATRISGYNSEIYELTETFLKLMKIIKINR
ncbi:MAG TPA: hypothetical protein DHV28_06715 [Ignavibacteriales bacterium]|nr:hypothetical protein [Ignavibacteriales bacterium]